MTGQRWRDAEKIEGIRDETGIVPSTPEQRLALLQIYPHTIGEGRDRKGRPLRIECVGRMNSDALLRHFDNDWDKVIRYHVYQSELCRDHFAQATKDLGHSVYDTTMIIDMSGGSVGKLNKFPANYRSKLSSLLSDQYPESMAKTLIVNAPLAITGAWSAASVMLDARTVSKVEIISNQASGVARLLE